MEHQKAVSFCTLKVNIKCCTKCQMRAKEKMQKIHGVKSVVNDSKGVMTVSGEVNPMTIVKKVESWGKKAELLSLQKSPKQDVQDTSIEKPRAAKVAMDKDCSCLCDAVSVSDSDDDGRGRGRDKGCEEQAVKPEKSNGSSIGQQPDVAIDNQNNTKSKRKKGFLGLFSKKGGATKVEKPSVVVVDEPSKWQFPKTFMPVYGGSRPHYQPFRPCPPPVMPSGPPYYPYGSMRPMPPQVLVPPPYGQPAPPPYGVFNSRPPPKVNPMIHYTSYADNYSR